MWHGCLQAVRSTRTDRRVRKHARRTWSVSARIEDLVLSLTVHVRVMLFYFLEAVVIVK